jgi:hypothetical protein
MDQILKPMPKWRTGDRSIVCASAAGVEGGFDRGPLRDVQVQSGGELRLVVGVIWASYRTPSVLSKERHALEQPGVVDNARPIAPAPTEVHYRFLCQFFQLSIGHESVFSRP